MIGAMILIMWLFMWRPESKRRKQMQKFREGLKSGDKVITAQYAGSPVKIDGVEYSIVRQSDILAIVE